MKVDNSLTTAAVKHGLVQPQAQQSQMQNGKTSVWSREKVCQLIELYKKHECLWNHWHEAYKSKCKRNQAIENICKTLNIPKFEFGKKIHNLRNQFNTEMKKLEQRKEEAGVNLDDTELRCKWSHFESLMFLRDVIEPRPGGYQTNFQSSKKMRLKFDFNSSDDEINVITVPPSSSGSNNTTNPEDLSQFPYDDNLNEELVTDDFQSFENEADEVDQPTCGEEVCDKKYHPQQQEITNFIKPTKNNKSLHLPQTPSTCSSQTNINVNEHSPAVGLNSSNVTVVPSHSHILSTASTLPQPITTPVISSITSSSSTESHLRDQWDAFGELVANEFRYLNSDISRKRLKRKIMQAMLEVGEEDDHLMATNRLTSN